MGALDPISGTLGAKRAAHLLRRLTFGPNSQQIKNFANLTVHEAMEVLFQNFAAPLPPTTPDGTQWTTTPPSEDEEDFKLFNSFKYWWLYHMYHSNNALEKLVFFLHTIITTKVETGGSARDIYFQNALFRRYLIQDFDATSTSFNQYPQLIKKICIDNSMLCFLDGRLNVKGRPNENFARELFELFTLGKGPTVGVGNYTHYTETDIKEAAKVLTGWDKDATYSTIDTETLLPRGKIKGSVNYASAHDNTRKVFTTALASAAYPSPVITPNQTLLNGAQPTEASAADEISQLIDIIYAKKAASEYFVRRFYRFYVHHQITEKIETEVIEPTAKIFRDSGFRVRHLMETLCKSRHFFELGGAEVADDIPGGMIKSPLDLVIGTLRYFNVSFPPVGTEACNAKMRKLENYINSMGLAFLDPYDVAGYEPYYQAPAYNRNWINTNTLLRRYAFIQDLFEPKTDGLAYIDPIEWFDSASAEITDDLATQPTVVNGQPLALDLVEYLASKLLVYSDRNREISNERYNYFALYHLGGLPFENWVQYWSQRKNPGSTTREDTRALMRNILNVLMQSPEFQMM